MGPPEGSGRKIAGARERRTGQSACVPAPRPAPRFPRRGDQPPTRAVSCPLCPRFRLLLLLSDLHLGRGTRDDTRAAERDAVAAGVQNLLLGATAAQIGAAAHSAGPELHGLTERGESLERLFLRLTEEQRPGEGTEAAA